MTSYHPVKDQAERLHLAHHILHDPHLEEVLFGYGSLTEETHQWLNSLSEDDVLFLLRSLSSLDRISLFRSLPTKSYSSFLALRPSEQSIVIPYVSLDNLAKIFSKMDSERRVHVARHLAQYAVDCILPFLTEDEVHLYKEHSPDRRSQLAYWLRSFTRSEIIDDGKLLTEAQVVQSIWSLQNLLKYIGWPDDATDVKSFDLPQVLFVVDDKHSLIGWILGQTLLSYVLNLAFQCRVSNDSESVHQTVFNSCESILVQDIMKPLSTLTFPCYQSSMLMTDLYQDLRNVLPTLVTSINILPVVNNAEDNVIVGYLRLSEITQEILNHTTGQQPILFGEAPLISESYSKASIWLLFQKRIGWLCLLIVANLGSSFAIQGFEVILEEEILLAAFIPLMIDTGGNIGNQIATMIVTALYTRDVDVHHWLTVLKKEAWVAVCLGIVLGIAGGCLTILVSFLSEGEINWPVTLIVGLSLFCMALMANTIGLFLPMISVSLGIDPSVSCGPILTTIVDVSGILMFLSLARYILSQI